MQPSAYESAISAAPGTSTRDPREQVAGPRERAREHELERAALELARDRAHAAADQEERRGAEVERVLLPHGDPGGERVDPEQAQGACTSCGPRLRSCGLRCPYSVTSRKPQASENAEIRGRRTRCSHTIRRQTSRSLRSSGRAPGRSPRARPSRSRGRRSAARASARDERRRLAREREAQARARRARSAGAGDRERGAAAAASASSSRTIRGWAACSSAISPHGDHAAVADHADALAERLDLAQHVRREEHGRARRRGARAAARRSPPARSGRGPRSARRARAARARAAAPARCRASGACRASTRATGRARSAAESSSSSSARARPGRATAGQRSEVVEQVDAAHALVEARRARQVAEPLAVAPRPSAHGSWPSTETLPASARSSPSAIRIAVVLPAPFGPRKPNTSPCSTSQVEAVERAPIAEALDETGERDGRIGHRTHRSRGPRKRRRARPRSCAAGPPDGA